MIEIDVSVTLSILFNRLGVDARFGPISKAVFYPIGSWNGSVPKM